MECNVHEGIAMYVKEESLNINNKNKNKIRT